MQSRNELLYSLHLANQAGDTEVADDIYVELESLDEAASLSELIPDVATPSNVQEQTSWDYVKDQMKLRYGDWGSLLKRMGAASSYDIATAAKQSEIFDHYWDKYHKGFVTMNQTEGRVNPKLYGAEAPKTKSKK